MGPTKYISNPQIYIVIIPAAYTIYWTKILLYVTQSIVFKEVNKRFFLMLKGGECLILICDFIYIGKL